MAANLGPSLKQEAESLAREAVAHERYGGLRIACAQLAPNRSALGRILRRNEGLQIHPVVKSHRLSRCERKGLKQIVTHQIGHCDGPLQSTRTKPAPLD